MNRLLVGRCTENLFRKIEGIIGALLKCQERVIIQILQSDGFLPCKRMGRTDEYMRTGFEERMEYQMVLFQEFLHDSFIKAAEIDDSDLASEVRHVLYDLIGPGLDVYKRQPLPPEAERSGTLSALKTFHALMPPLFALLEQKEVIL